MAVNSSLPCVHYLGCADGVNYLVFLGDAGIDSVYDLDNGAAPVTDQAIVDAITPGACSDIEIFHEYVQFDSAVHPDGGLNGDPFDPANPLEIPVHSCTSLYQEGDVLTYDVTLPDGTTLAAGDPVPANICIVAEEAPFDGALIDSLAIDKTQPTAPVFEYVSFDATTHLINGLLGTGVTGDAFQIPVSCKTEGREEGETLLGDVTLPDGTALAAGDPVPAGWLVLEEVDQLTGTIIESTPVKQTCTVTYVEGDVLAYDIVLSDGTTLTAGDPVPAGFWITNEETIGGDYIEGNSFFADSGTDTDTRLVKLTEGEIAVFDITLADGTVIATGDPLPAGVCATYYEDATTGTYVPGNEDVFETSDENHTPEVLLPGDTYTEDIVAADGTIILAAGDPVPADLCIFLELDTAGNIVEVDAHAKSPAVDFKSWITDPAIECVDATSVLATDGTNCGPIDLQSVLPTHSFAICDHAGETITPTGTPTGPIANTFDAQFLDSGQFGDQVFEPNGGALGINPGSFPLSMPVPAATPGTVLGLHLSYGVSWNDDFQSVGQFTGLTAVPNGSDIAAFSAVGHQDLFEIPHGGFGVFPTAQHDVFIMDAVTGGSATTIDIDFTQWPSNDVFTGGGVFTWQWIEISDTSDGQLNVSDFNLGAVQFSEAGEVQAGVTTPTSDSPEWDLGPCPAVVWGAGRHVASSPNACCPPGELDHPTDWWTASLEGAGVEELYDKVSYNAFFACQMGWSAAFVDGGIGPWSWNYQANNGVPDTNSDPAGAIALPLATCESDGPSEGGMATSSPCADELINPNCSSSGYASCTIQAAIKLTAEPGETVSAVPMLNGAAVPIGTVEFTNYGATTECIIKNINVEVTDTTTLIAPGANYTFDGSFNVTNSAGTGSAEIIAAQTKCELIHV